MKLPFFLLLLLALAGCAAPDAVEGGRLRHATLLHIGRGDDHSVVTVRNPWDTTRVLQRYVLVPHDAPLPSPLPEGTLIRTPLRRTLSQSSVHAALAVRLEVGHRLAGICDEGYVISPAVRTLALTDYGSGMQPDVERIAADSVDALLVSPFENAGHGNLARLNIPIVECADYMEGTPLGRAEWMRFYGMLWGCEERADSLFSAEEKAYLDLRRKVADGARNRPTLMVDRKEGAAWHVPGGKSYLAVLYADAGAHYLFAHHARSGSVALSLESVLATARSADVWVIKYGASANLTYASLLTDNAACEAFRPYRERRVFGCNTLAVPYYEDLPFSPSILLAEWVAMLHPELLPAHRPRYFFPLR